MGTPYKHTLKGAELELKDTRGFVPPYTVSLASTSPNRAIQITIDGGNTWEDVVLDTDKPTVIGVVMNSRVGGIKFTGEAGDTARIIAS